MSWTRETKHPQVHNVQNHATISGILLHIGIVKESLYSLQLRLFNKMCAEDKIEKLMVPRYYNIYWFCFVCFFSGEKYAVIYIWVSLFIM